MGPRRGLSVLTGFLLAALAPASAGEPEGRPLTLPDLEALALAHNPTLAQAAAQVAASRAKALQAGLYPNPTAGYIGDLMGVQGTAGELQGGFLQQTIITAGKLRLSRAKYNQEACEAEIKATGQQLRVLSGVHVHWYDLLAIQRMVDLHKKLQENADESLRTHKEMANTGQASKADVLLAEVAASRARIGLRTQENRAVAAWASLAAVVGCPDLPPAPLQGPLEPDGPALEWAASLERLLRDSPELLAAQAHVIHDQITLHREKVQPIPDIQIQANTGYDYETGNTVAGAQVGVEIPLFDRNQGTIKQVQADLARSHAEVRRVELSLRQRLAETFNQYLTAHQTAQAYREVMVPRATEAHQIMVEMYKKRRAPWPDVVRLERALFDVQAEYTQSLLELRRAEVAINGLLLVGGLTEPQPPTPGGHIDATPKPR